MDWLYQDLLKAIQDKLIGKSCQLMNLSIFVPPSVSAEQYSWLSNDTDQEMNEIKTWTRK